MITMKELGAPIRQWVPDWLGLICIFIVILPVTMLNGSYTGSMYHDRPDIDRFIYLVPISFGTSVRESGAFIPAESHYRLFLYDACHVFQYFDYLVDQLPDQYLKGRQHPYLFPLYLFASGICLGGVHLFLVVPVATLAVSFLDSGRNELFRPILREPLFRELPG